MKLSVKWLMAFFMAVFFVSAAVALPVYAASVETEVSAEEQEETADATGAKAIGVCLAIGLAGGAGALAMGIAGGKTSEAIARQPEAEGSIRTSFMLNMVFIETAIIYALLVAIMVIFVL